MSGRDGAAFGRGLSSSEERHASYSVPSWLSNRHAQTVFASLVRLPILLPLARERWELPDGDFVDVDRLAAPIPDAPLVVICHGLEGSSRAGYVLGLMRELAGYGLAALALNFRGCSGEPNRLPRFYHSGDTGDLAFVIERLMRERPARALGLAGFSLGGNVVAKYLGERGDGVSASVRAAAVVSAPFDLELSAAVLDGPDVMARVYRGRFLRRLRAKLRDKARRFAGQLPGLDLAAAAAARNFREFDERVTAPLHGFAGALDYWARSSAGPLLPSVQRPLLILASDDDPFVPASAVPRSAATANPRLTLEAFATGGHVAFVHGPPWAPRRFAEARAARFLADRLR
jgi:predicted alpha/beta-fold hydrolase